jgi:surfactin synthase thioesterase subunit/malonyl CoA-acyl carrier protein transacylase
MDRVPMRLVCFHHAGGDASLFSGWQHRLADDVEVVPVTLPGRGGDQRVKDLNELVDRLEESLTPLLNGPHLVYGHSFGGLVGYELVRRRAARGLRAPEALLVGAFPAPDVAHTLDSLELDEDSLIEFMLEISGMPREVLAYPDWVDSVTASLREDLLLWRTHRDEPGSRIPCPIHVFSGTEDWLVPRDHMAGWADRTTATYRLHQVDGGHFFVRENRAEFLELLRAVLTPYTAAPAAVPRPARVQSLDASPFRGFGTQRAVPMPFDAAAFTLGPGAPVSGRDSVLATTAWQLLERVMIPPASTRGRQVGVFVERSLTPEAGDGDDALPGAGRSAARLSATYGWQGPVGAPDAGTSPGRAALAAAHRALRRGECDLAMAAAAPDTWAEEPLRILRRQEADHADRPAPSASGEAATAPRALPWVLSAHDAPTLLRQADRLRTYVTEHPDLDLDAIAYALAAGRSPLAHRAALVAADRSEVLAGLEAIADDGFAVNVVPPARAADEPTAFLFTGQGSQRPGMGRELHAEHPVFAAALEEIAERFDRHLDQPLLDVMFAEPGSEQSDLLNLTLYAQPALFALEAALFRLVTHWGLTPSQVIGHSLGELVAAHVAGVFSLDDACDLVAARARLMQSAPAGGAMIAVAADEATVTRALERHGDGRVDIAAVNTATATVISGDEEPAGAVAAALAEEGFKTTRLRVSHAFHSLHMEGILEEFRTVASKVDYHAPRIPVVSNLTGMRAGDDELGDPDYWVEHIRRPVRFAQGIGWLAGKGVTSFLELGPSPVLSAFARMAAPEGGFAYALRPGLPEGATLNTAVATLFTRGAQPDWEAVFGPAAEPGAARRAAADLPAYPFPAADH